MPDPPKVTRRTTTTRTPGLWDTRIKRVTTTKRGNHTERSITYSSEWTEAVVNSFVIVFLYVPAFFLGLPVALITRQGRAYLRWWGRKLSSFSERL